MTSATNFARRGGGFDKFSIEKKKVEKKSGALGKKCAGGEREKVSQAGVVNLEHSSGREIPVLLTILENDLPKK